jgi:hypothetical protein
LQVLKREFVRFGDIASVKIMWPRDEDQRRRGRNCGFVAFMVRLSHAQRPSQHFALKTPMGCAHWLMCKGSSCVTVLGQTRAGADRAKAELNGVLLHDLELKIGWGKAVAIPPVPLHTAASVAAGSKGIPLPKAAGAAVPPPGVEAAPPWKAPQSEDQLEGIGATHALMHLHLLSALPVHADVLCPNPARSGAPAMHTPMKSYETATLRSTWRSMQPSTQAMLPQAFMLVGGRR